MFLLFIGFFLITIAVFCRCLEVQLSAHICCRCSLSSVSCWWLLVRWTKRYALDSAGFYFNRIFFAQFSIILSNLKFIVIFLYHSRFFRHQKIQPCKCRDKIREYWCNQHWGRRQGEKKCTRQDLKKQRRDLRFGKTGNKKRATCFATLLQNELNSDVARFTTHIKPVLQQIRLLTGLSRGGKTPNIAIQLVLQQCCKTSCPFFVARFSVPLGVLKATKETLTDSQPESISV